MKKIDKKVTSEVTSSVDVLNTGGDINIPTVSNFIAPLAIDFSRADLNLMRDKINEIISRR